MGLCSSAQMIEPPTPESPPLVTIDELYGPFGHEFQHADDMDLLQACRNGLAKQQVAENKHIRLIWGPDKSGATGHCFLLNKETSDVIDERYWRDIKNEDYTKGGSCLQNVILLVEALRMDDGNYISWKIARTLLRYKTEPLERLWVDSGKDIAVLVSYL
jgi:hypothetical protein